MPTYDKAFYITLAFIVGIFFGVYFTNDLFVFLLVFILLLGFGLLSLIYENKYLFILFLCFLVIGPAFFYGNSASIQAEGTYPDLNVITSVSGEIKQSTKYLSSNLYKVNLDEPYEGVIYLYADIFDKFDVGDKINIKGVLNKSPKSGRVNTWNTNIELIEKGSAGIRQLLFNFKKGIVNHFDSVLPQKESALLAGLTVGERGGFSKEFKESMSKSGTTHLVALSGYNITILIYIISLVFSYFLSRKYTFWLSIVFIVLFVIMVGGEASIVRAAVMGVIALLAKQSGRLYSVRNAIAISAGIMILIHPLSISDVGFQLSFLALLGIVYVAPVFEYIFKMENMNSFLNWKENLLITSSAQLAVMPLILYYFNFFSLFSLVSNILVLELVPYAMLLGLILAMFSFSSLFSSLIALVVGVILRYQIFVIESFAKISLLSINVEIGVWFIVLYYLLMGVLIWWGFNRNRDICT